jgi:hypothetical protein
MSKIQSPAAVSPSAPLVPGAGDAGRRGSGLRGNPALTLPAVALGVMMVGCRASAAWNLPR